jgi:hypothetical protein
VCIGTIAAVRTRWYFILIPGLNSLPMANQDLYPGCPRSKILRATALLCRGPCPRQGGELEKEYPDENLFRIKEQLAKDAIIIE